MIQHKIVKNIKVDNFDNRIVNNTINSKVEIPNSKSYISNKNFKKTRFWMHQE